MSSVQPHRNGWRVRFRHAGRQQSASFLTRAQAEKWKALLDQVGAEKALAVRDQPETATVRTVEEQVRHHVEHLTGVTAGTRSDYLDYLTRDIAPHIGAVPLTLLTRDDVAAWVNHLATVRGLSGKSIRNRHGLLSAALTSAINDPTQPLREHPSKGMRLPGASHETVEMVFLTGPEWQLLHAALPERWRPLATTLVGTGMRFGEATALMVRDVDLKTRSARVRQAWKHTDGKGYELGPPKSKRSIRTIALPPEVVTAIAPLIDDRRPDAFIFTNTRGGPVRQNAFHGGPWTDAVRVLAGDVKVTTKGPVGRPTVTWRRGPGKRPRIHDLRHTFASWAIQAGIPLPVIQRSLGHESIVTTIDRYGHLARADFDALAEATSSQLRPVTQPRSLE